MTALLHLLLAGFLILSPMSRAAEPEPKAATSVPPGMKVYYVGLLKKGPKWNRAEEDDLAKFLADHVGYLAKLEKDGRVVVAGSFLGSSNLRGMVIYKVRTLAEARALVRNDPGVQSGRLLIDVYPWLSADGLRVVGPPGSAGTVRPPGKGPATKSAPKDEGAEKKPAADGEKKPQ
jgi:uncharacterized protein